MRIIYDGGGNNRLLTSSCCHQTAKCFKFATSGGPVWLSEPKGKGEIFEEYSSRSLQETVACGQKSVLLRVGRCIFYRRQKPQGQDPLQMFDLHLSQGRESLLSLHSRPQCPPPEQRGLSSARPKLTLCKNQSCNSFSHRNGGVIRR